MDYKDPVRMCEDTLELLPDSPLLMVDPSLGKADERSPKLCSLSSHEISGAPKRFKSTFIFFSMEKHKEIKAQLQRQGPIPKSTNITKLVSEAWRNLGPDDKAKYEDLAREDKARYDEERAKYKDERGLIGSRKKKVKDPSAPKRPMSAFLAFANSRRAEVKAQNPECTNGEISRLLSVMWKEAPEVITKKYREDEAILWKTYRVGIVAWRKKNDGRKKANKGLEAAAAMKKQTTTKKKKTINSNSVEDETSLADNSFDDSHFGGFGAQGLESGVVDVNQDEIRAASVALRGVRSGTNNAFQLSAGGGSNGMAGLGMGGMGPIGFEGGMQQNFQQGAGGGLGSSFGMNTIGSFGTDGMADSAGCSLGATVGFGQGLGNFSPNRALLEMGFPYQQYGSYASAVSNHPQALMAHGPLRGNPVVYLGLADQQTNLSQLASLAGGQTSTGSLGQSPGSMGVGLGCVGTTAGMGSMGGTNGMGCLLNDNSSNRSGAEGMLKNGF